MRTRPVILFIRPPFEGMTEYKPPHMGIACLYNYINESFPQAFEFLFIDSLSLCLSVSHVKQQIVTINPDIVCITVKTMQVEQSLDLIQFIKKETDALVICGGNHVSVEPGLFVKAGADFSVVGPGERSLRDIILSAVTGDRALLCSPKVVCGENKIFPKLLNRLKIEEFVPDFLQADRKIGVPNWDLINISDYNENIHINKSIPSLPIMASRGCPYKCDFCSSVLTWGTSVSYRDPSEVLYEICSGISKYNIKNFHFYDDNLLINREWMKSFLDLVKKTKVEFNWICLSRPEIIVRNQDLLHDMKECGCKGFELGLETYDPMVYAFMNKKNTVDSFMQAYNLLVELRFEMIEFLIMCFYPGETIQSIYSTYEQVCNFKKQSAYFVSSRYFATPFKGTKFYNSHLENGFDLGGEYLYKYALYLNYMPFSFIQSRMGDFHINPQAFDFQRSMRGDFDHLIYKNEITKLSDIVTPPEFAKKFNQFSDKGALMTEFLESLFTETGVKKNAIYEFIGRNIEFAARTNVMEPN